MGAKGAIMRVCRTLWVFVTLALVAVACGGEAELTTTLDVAAGAEPTLAATTVPTVATTQLSDTTTTEATGPLMATGRFMQLVESGDVTLEVVSPEGGVSGTLLDVALANTTDQEIELVIPCGLVFLPDDWVEPPGPGEEPLGPDDFGTPSDQRMINLTPIDVTLGPGGEIVVTPYVMCIDSSSPAPDPGATYEAGTLAGDELFALANCVCDEDFVAEIDPLVGDLGLQTAIWAAAEGALPDVEGALAESEGALGGVLGDELEFDSSALEALEELEDLDLEGVDLEALGLEGFDMEAMIEQAMSFMEEYNAGAQEWLDRCEIDLEGST